MAYRRAYVRKDGTYVRSSWDNRKPGKRKSQSSQFSSSSFNSQKRLKEKRNHNIAAMIISVIVGFILFKACN